MLELFLSVAIFVLLVIPVGNYLYKVSAMKKTFGDCVFDKVDNCIYKICGINPNKEMNWLSYSMNLLVTNLIMIVFGYLVLRLQGQLFLNPNDIESMNFDLAFNTIISFMTNTNLQHYSGESGLSYASQLFVICYMMFVAAGSGYAACIAFIRGLARYNEAGGVGNYYVDMVRIVTRVLIPISFIVSLLLVWQGVPQNLDKNLVLTTLEGTKQVIPMGPAAAVESIKHLGTNGGGFIGANSATPIENPNIITDLIELYTMMILPGACVVTFGKMVRDRLAKQKDKMNINLKPSWTSKCFGREGRSLFLAMLILFVISLGVCYWAESQGNPILAHLGLNQSMGSMEGKEVRFGIAQSCMFTNTTTTTATGTVNNMHDTLTAIGGMVPLFNMMLNCIFGGIGVGLMNIVIYAIVAVFICGLMIGRTPEYLSKKIEGKEMKLAALVIIIHPLLILGFSAIAVMTQGGLEGITNPGYHGLSQIFYEYSSSAANNGSGFEGLNDNTFFWNISTGIVMFLGRYVSIFLNLAIAGSLIRKHYVSESTGTLHTDNVSFAIILVFVVYIFAALTFLPALTLGPVAEYLTLGF